MKKFLAGVLSVCLLCGALTLTGCGGKSLDTDDTYNVFIYKVQREQLASGEVVHHGYKLQDSFTLPSGQMYEITKYEEFENIDGTYKVGKYKYSGFSNGYTVVDHEKLQVFPDDHETILLTERKLKTISFYYEGQNIYDSLNSTNKGLLDSDCKNTYSEDFSISASLVTDVLGSVNSSVTLGLYTNAECTGKPFAWKTFSYSSYSGLSGTLSFSLLQTTNVYVKVS
ncbi:MAG: hypothetical protein IJ996_04680 [Clostridia bacterium]|nr:hypothetical protein [Clostridia bacterium]